MPVQCDANAVIKFVHSNPHFKYIGNSCIIIIYLHICGLIINPLNDLLPVGLKARLLEHCIGIAEVRVRVPVQAILAAV